ARKIKVMSVMADDQTEALRFYTDVLGFVKKREIPLGAHSWLTVVSPDAPDGTELSLEPDTHPAARPFKEALVADGIPFTSFAVDDVHAEFARLRQLGVLFTQEPAEMGPVTTAVFDDTCGNLIQIAARAQPRSESPRAWAGTSRARSSARPWRRPLRRELPSAPGWTSSARPSRRTSPRPSRSSGDTSVVAAPRRRWCGDAEQFRQLLLGVGPGIVD